MQMESLECGAAALAMILAYYGKWMPLEQVRVDCGVSRDGASIENIAKAARSYGLEVEGYQRSIDALQEQGPFPASSPGRRRLRRAAAASRATTPT